MTALAANIQHAVVIREMCEAVDEEDQHVCGGEFSRPELYTMQFTPPILTHDLNIHFTSNLQKSMILSSLSERRFPANILACHMDVRMPMLSDVPDTLPCVIHLISHWLSCGV